MKLLAVGTVAFDAIETPFGKTDKILGGAATYIGMAASVLNTDVSLVSVVGGDFPQEYLDMMTQKGIGIDGIEIIKEGKTFFGRENIITTSTPEILWLQSSMYWRVLNQKFLKMRRMQKFYC